MSEDIKGLLDNCPLEVLGGEGAGVLGLISPTRFG